MVVDVPSGRLTTVAVTQDQRVQSVRFKNVPSFVLEDRLTVSVAGRRVEVAIAYGGAFYAIVPAERFELPIEPAFVPRFIDIGRDIKAAIEADRDIAHPLQPELQGIYGVMFTMGNRNVTVFADGEVDRSPCGSGTSARLALLDRRGELARGTTLLQGQPHLGLKHAGLPVLGREEHVCGTAHHLARALVALSGRGPSTLS